MLKKWALTILAALGLVALGLTTHRWLPWLIGFAAGHKEGVESLNKLADLLTKLVTWIAAVSLFIFKLWRDKTSDESKVASVPAQRMEQVRAAHDAIQAGGNVQTGGTSVMAGAGSVAAGVVQTVIQQQTVVQHVSPSGLNSLYSLPPPPADFTGREAELAELRKAIEEGGVHISGLQGQGGVGKTALALKLAEELSPNYPDAQIYMDLRGVSEKPLTPAEAMAYVIRACHPDAKLPESEAELKGAYLNLLHGKKALLLMDNARDRAHVEPLIPPPGCIFLVTSRNQFALPGLRAKNLDSLPPADAERLLLEIEKRIDGEAGHIARLCGYLPLALRLAASALAERPDLLPAEYTRRLEKERLKLLPENEASIGISYALLDAEKQKRWRMLGAFPDTFDAPAAASIWELESDAAKDTLGPLIQLSMLEWNDTAKRYRLHDLMRDFARLRLQKAGETEGAARRHARYYAEVLSKADGLYREGGDSIKPGLALFDLEWGNVQAGQAWAAARAQTDNEAARLCSRYPSAGTYCLELRQHPRGRITWREAALAAARSLKNRGAESAHLGNLGVAYHGLGEYRRAIEYHEQHLAIAREIGDRQGEGNALGNLGSAYHSLGEYRRAIEYHEEALIIDREIGNRRGEGQSLGNLGSAHHSLGDYRRAIEYYGQRLAIAREIGDRLGEGNALGNLGNAYLSLGDYRRAIEYHEQHLAIAREIGDRQGESNALWNQSLAHDRLGEHKEAVEHAEAAVKIYQQIEAPAAARVRKQLEEWKKQGPAAPGGKGQGSGAGC